MHLVSLSVLYRPLVLRTNLLLCRVFSPRSVGSNTLTLLDRKSLMMFLQGLKSVSVVVSSDVNIDLL